MLPTDPTTALTVGGLGALAAIVVGALKIWEWALDRLQKRFDTQLKAAEEATVQAVAKAGLSELKSDAVERELNLFKLEVVRDYVRHEQQRQLEERIEKGFSAMREDLNDLRASLMQAFSDSGRPPRTRREA